MKASIQNIQPVTEQSRETQKLSVRRAVGVPLKSGESMFYTFRGLKDTGEHVAVSFGTLKSHSTLVRIHSECLTGDVFGSAKCDCGEQLNEAMEKLRQAGGLLIYLRQEGRGIGLYNKLDAYALQNAGSDTYQANRLLGFDDDLRKYDVAAQMLKALDIKSVRLLSNNPDKRAQLEKCGIQVNELVSTGVFVSSNNQKYLEAKVHQTGHKIDLKGGQDV